MMMKIKQKDLNDKLQKVCAIVDGKLGSDPTDKILDCVHFNVTPEKIFLVAGSSHIQTKTTIVGHFCEKSISFSVNAQYLSGFVRSLPSLLDIEFSISDQSVEIVSGKTSFILPNLIEIPYPIFNIQTKEKLLTMETKKMEKAFQSVSFSMGDHHFRYYLAGCKVDVKNMDMSFVSTDIHRLSLYNIKNESLEGVDKSIIIPKRAVSYIHKVLLSMGDGLAEIETSSDDFFVLTVGDYEVIGKLIIGAYPEYEKVFSEEGSRYVIADMQQLKQSVQLVSVLANDKFKTIRFTFTEGLLKIDSKSIRNEIGKTEMEVKYAGEELSFNFNAGYLSDLLTHFDEKEVKISFSEENSFIFFSFEGNDQFKYVLMPLRL